MKIKTRRMVAVAVIAETEDDARLVRSINGWLRENKIVTCGRREKTGGPTTGEFEVLLSAEDADRLLSYVGAPQVRMAYAPQAGDGTEVV